MLYKSSKYNYYTESNNNGIILYNSYKGLKSIHKVKNENVDEVVDLLQGAENVELDSDLKKKLSEYNFLVPMDSDEYKNLQFMYLGSINSPNLSLAILPTEKCNYRCKYCYESFERGRMPKEIQDGIVAFVKKYIHNYKSLTVSWFGGEPLLEVPIIEDLSSKLMKICNMNHIPYLANLTSNGYFLTPEVIEKLVKLKVTHYMITIDGIKKTHDAQKPLANGDGTFDTVINNLLHIKNNVKSRMFHITIRTNFTEQMSETISEYIDTFYEYFGDDKRFSFFARPAGDWGGDRVKKISDNLFEESAFEQIFEKIISHEKKMNFGTHLSFLEPCGSMCSLANLNSYLIDSAGNVRKCSCELDSEDNIIGKIDKTGNMNIDENKEAKWSHYFELSEKCKDCNFAPACLDNSCLANYVTGRNTDEECHVYEKKYLKQILQLCEKTEEIEELV